MTSILCVIPARGGSKGVPGKNLREIAGKPLIVWTIEHALAMITPQVSVVVSTDDPVIAEVAREAGAHTPFLRPAELAQDDTPTEPVVLHALDHLSGATPDAVMLLQATSPVRHPGTLDRAIAEFAGGGFDSLVGVVPQAPFLWQRHGDADPTAAYDVNRRLRRQDMGPDDLRYRETGSLYVTRTDIYRTLHNRLGGGIGLFVMAEDEGIDVDTELDLQVADITLRTMSGTTSKGHRP